MTRTTTVHEEKTGHSVNQAAHEEKTTTSNTKNMHNPRGAKEENRIEVKTFFSIGFGICRDVYSACPNA